MQLGELIFNLGFKTTGTTEAQAFGKSLAGTHTVVTILSTAMERLIYLVEEIAIKMDAVTRSGLDAKKSEKIGQEDDNTKVEEKSNKIKEKKISIIGVLNKKMKEYWGVTNAARLQILGAATAITFLVKKSAEAAVHIDKLSSVTGLSTNTLAHLGDMAAQTGSSVDDIAGAVSNFQKQSIDISLGRGGNIGAYNLLGLNPHEDPIKLLDQIGKKLKTLPAAYGANLARDLGLSDDLIYMLKNTGSIKPADPETFLTESENKRLKEFYFYFNRVFEQGKRVLQKFAAFLTPVATMIVYYFERVSSMSGKALNALEPHLEKMQKWFKPLALMGTALFVAFFPLTAAFLALALIFEDIASWVNGDRSVFGNMLKYINDINGATKDLIHLYIQLRKFFTLGDYDEYYDQLEKDMLSGASSFAEKYKNIKNGPMSPALSGVMNYQNNMENEAKGNRQVIFNVAGNLDQKAVDDALKRIENSFEPVRVGEGKKAYTNRGVQ